MNTSSNLGIGTGSIASTAPRREARMDRVDGKLEQQSQKVRGMSATELAAYRSYGSDVSSDIDNVCSYCGENPVEESGETGDLANEERIAETVARLEALMTEINKAIASNAEPGYIMNLLDQSIGLIQTLLFEMMAQAEQDDLKAIQRANAERNREQAERGQDGGDTDGPTETENPGETESQRDKDQMTPVRAAKILAKYFDLLDTAAGHGKKDNVVEMADIKAVSKNPDAPEELRKAAEYVVRNPMVAHALDVGNHTDEVDGRFGIKDFERFAKEHEGKEGYDTPVPDKTKPPVSPTAPSEETSDDESPTAPTPPSPTTPQPTTPSDDGKVKATQLATRLREAMEGAGTDEAALISVLVNLSNREISQLKEAYQTAYGESLAERVYSETNDMFSSGNLRDTLASLLQGNRDESGRFDKNQVQNDAHALHEASDGMGTTESKFIEVFTKRSKAHLKEVSSTYQSVYGQTLAQLVESETSGDFKDALLALLN